MLLRPVQVHDQPGEKQGFQGSVLAAEGRDRRDLARAYGDDLVSAQGAYGALDPLPPRHTATILVIIRQLTHLIQSHCLFSQCASVMDDLQCGQSMSSGITPSP